MRKTSRCNELKARTKERIQDLKVQRTQSSNKGEIVDSGTLRNSRLAKNRTESKPLIEARTKEKQWTVALSTYPTGQESKPLLSLTSKKGETVDSGTLRTDWPGIEAVADWPRIEAVAEFRVALYHIAEWPRIEAVAEFRLWPRIEAVAEFRLRGNGEVPPVYVTYRRKRRRPTICNLHEEMEKTHLICNLQEEMEKTHLM
ncbi:unnamed protein product [Rodentolepis nana]|uniref:Uncharacterized protein n=1 Tax=Rodentolepis nana TaxID=102285 RepID=A0A0R3TU28_RODNA|nr:unnamed protein product [Rodentolepis nana]